MKGYITILCFGLLFPSQCVCQDTFPVDNKGNISYSDIVKTDSTSAKELYVRAHSWFANSFKSAKSVIQMDDKEAGKIIGKGFIIAGISKSNSGVIKMPIAVSVNFTVDIQTKDGRYKYLFTDFSCTRFEGTEYETTLDLYSKSFIRNAIWQKSLDKDWLEVKQDINIRMLDIIESLNKAMITSSSDW